jgi:invasion protein IalB
MIALVFAAALMAAAPAAAETAAQATPPTKSEKAKKDDLVCKKEAVVGSRMKTRVCLTQAEWDQRQADARADIEKGQSVKPLTF